jgi:hypothetical protein
MKGELHVYDSSGAAKLEADDGDAEHPVRRSTADSGQC